ncbi:MAG: DnaJ C-terminal domain-containing protein [Planctomycetota bacterium]
MRQVELRDGERGGIEKIEFRVPAAVSDGQRIRVKGKGQPGTGGRGDVMIRCRIAAGGRCRRPCAAPRRARHPSRRRSRRRQRP